MRALGVEKTPYRTHLFLCFCAFARILVSCLLLRSTLSLSQFSVSSEISDRTVARHRCSTVPLKYTVVRLPLVQRYEHSFISLISNSLTNNITHSSLQRCLIPLCIELHSMLNVKEDLHVCITLTQAVNLALLPEQHAHQAHQNSPKNTKRTKRTT